MAPNVKDVTFEVVNQNDDGSFTVRPVAGASNPYAGGGSSPNLPAVIGGGYVALINGRRVTFASEADAEVASAALSEMRGGGPVRELNAGWSRGGGGSGNGNGSGARFLRGGADAADAITGFFRGRNLRQKRDELLRAISASNAARDKLAGLNSRYSDLVPVLIDCMQSESDVNATALNIVDDQILGVDIQAGTGVARVMADMWDGMARDGQGGGEGFSALAVGGIGLGLGLLLSSRGRRGEWTR
jgi:hypothetical protein